MGKPKSEEERDIATGFFIYFMILMAVILVSVGMCTQANAQQIPGCAPTKDVVKKLKQGYGEHQVGAGLHHNGTLAALFISEGGNTWSIVQMYANGRACLVASGFRWVDFEIEHGDAL